MANTRPVVISKLIDENMENINANIQATRVLNAQILGTSVDNKFETDQRPSIQQYLEFNKREEARNVLNNMANISLNLSQSIETVSDLISFYSLHGSMNDLTQFFERLELVTNLFILICIKNTSITRYITHHTKRLRNKRNSLNKLFR